jgi:hypothetical protein
MGDAFPSQAVCFHQQKYNTFCVVLPHLCKACVYGLIDVALHYYLLGSYYVVVVIIIPEYSVLACAGVILFFFILLFNSQCL